MTDTFVLCDQTPTLVFLKQLLLGSNASNFYERLDHMRSMKLIQDTAPRRLVGTMILKTTPLRWYQTLATALIEIVPKPTPLDRCAYTIVRNLLPCIGSEEDASFKAHSPVPMVQRLLRACSESMGVRSSPTQRFSVWLDMDSRRLGCIEVELVVVGLLFPVVHVKIIKSIVHLAVALNSSRALLLEAGLDYLCALPAKDPAVTLAEALATLSTQVRRAQE